MVARFLRRFCRLSTSKANFLRVHKTLGTILLSKLSENSAISGKWIKCVSEFWCPWTFNINIQLILNTHCFSVSFANIYSNETLFTLTSHSICNFSVATTITIMEVTGEL